MPDTAEPELTVHPAAASFPMLSDDEMLALAADIAKHGLLQPLTLTADGKQLVDGRNRHRACQMAGIEPRFERLLKDVDPVAYICSVNIARRHLTAGQQAIALALLFSEPERGRGKVDPARKSAEAASLSYRRVQEGRQIARYPDLVREVRDGGLLFDVALKEARYRTEIASSAEAHMQRLRYEAPDLAALVDEERMPLKEACAAFEKRHAAEVEEERREREMTLRLVEGVYLGAVRMADAGFVEVLRRWTKDRRFRDELLAQLHFDPDAVGDDQFDRISSGAGALTRFLISLRQRSAQRDGGQSERGDG